MTDKLKDFQKLGFIILIFWFISIFTPVADIFILHFYGASIDQYHYSLKYFAYVSIIIKSMINMVIGFWIIKQKDTVYPFLWFLLSLVFGINALVLYFIMYYYNDFKNEVLSKIDSICNK